MDTRPQHSAELSNAAGNDFDANKSTLSYRTFFQWDQVQRFQNNSTKPVPVVNKCEEFFHL